jgi:hypothetical protein
LAGRILDSKSEHWDVLSLPAIDDDNEALWPEWYPLPTLRRSAACSGRAQFNALYQQSPMAAGGGVFKREWVQSYHKHDGGGLNLYMLIDPAGRKKSDNDYTSIWMSGSARTRTSTCSTWCGIG